MSLAKVSGGDFSRAFLNQVELGRSQPSTRVLRVIAGRLGTEVDYLLEGRLPNLDRELALERVRALQRGEAFSVGRGDPQAAIRTHLRLADSAMRAARSHDALEHYRAARVLLEATTR